MNSFDDLRSDWGQGLPGLGEAVAAADRLCLACVTRLDVNGAAVSFVHDGASRGTFGSSGETSRRLDEYQFTLGEGPCLDAVRTGRTIHMPDSDDPHEGRWPAFQEAVRREGVRAVFALPITVAATRVAALDLFRHTPGALSAEDLDGAHAAADLMVMPILDMMTKAVEWDPASDAADEWSQLASLERVEVYQATGMIMAQLKVGPVEALSRLRAYAFSNDMRVNQVAWSVLEGRLSMVDDDPGGPPKSTGGTP